MNLLHFVYKCSHICWPVWAPLSLFLIPNLQLLLVSTSNKALCFLSCTVRADLLHDFDVEDVLSFLTLPSVGKTMYQRRERVMITVLDVERLMLSRCFLADVHREETGHHPPRVRKQWRQCAWQHQFSLVFVYLFFLHGCWERPSEGRDGGGGSESWREVEPWREPGTQEMFFVCFACVSSIQ